MNMAWPVRNVGQTFGQAADDVHNEVDRHALPMEDRAMRLKEIALTATAIALPPHATARVAIGADIAPSGPAAIGAVGLRIEMLGGGAVAPTASRRDERGGRGRRARKHGRLKGLLTGLTAGLAGETGKGLRFF